jgi:DNA-binding MarR family transcriptional regulator
VVPAADLREQYRDGRMQDRDLRHLRRQGLIRTQPYVVGRTRTTLVTLTDRGREVLEESRPARGSESRQAFYAGISKPRELAHDVRLYRAYGHAAGRLAARGARVRRVVLEEQLKRDYQRFLQDSNRGRPDATGRPDRAAEEIKRWARERHLPYVNGHVEFPDVRIEYAERDGRRDIEDVEVTTPHYRGAHAAAKARAGFACYRGVGARVGGARLGLAGGGRRGGRGFDPRLAEEFLQ